LLSLRSVSDDAAQLDAGAARLRLLTIQPLLVSSLLATCLFSFCQCAWTLQRPRQAAAVLHHDEAAVIAHCCVA